MSPVAAEVNLAFNRPFQEQLDFFRQKINLPTERWDDILRAAHDRAFVVAGVTKADLLDSFRSEVDRAIEQGKSLQWFRGEFDGIVKRHGWTGWTGEGSKAGRDWRTRIIYQTNMSTSYAAGRWAQLNDPDLLKLKPYFTYRHADGIRHPRPHHLSWNGTTLPHDDAFWQTHSCPNGWLCHCRIESASARDFKAAQAEGKGIKPNGWNKIDPKTGEPVGIDKGFGYAPGASVYKQLQGIIAEKVKTLPPALGDALKTHVSKVEDRNGKIASLANSLTLPKSGVAKNSAKVLLDEIDKLHSVENLPVIPVKNSTSLGFQGRYTSTGRGEALHITISTASVNLELTLAHEIGHFIDHQAFGEGGIYASKAHTLLTKWREAIDNSAATIELRSLSNMRGIDRVASKRCAYYLNPLEQWARSYAQWVATRSENSIMIGQVTAIVEREANKIYSASQWSNADFEPIAAAIDEIFSTLGWLK